MARDRDSDSDEIETRPGEQTNEEKRQPRLGDLCACGASRLASGRCETIGLWPRYVWRREGKERFTLALKCPFACPVCFQPLEWHGGCYQCHGTVTSWDRDTWTVPGDRYERTEGGHWQKIDGLHPACTPTQNRDAAALVKRVLAGELTAKQAFDLFPFPPVDDGPADADGP